MRKVLLFGAISLGAAAVSAQVPQMVTVEPKTAKPGTVLSVTGVHLGPELVEEVYLTDHKFDLKVKVLEQKDKTLLIRVPPFVKPGRMQLMVLMAGKQPKLLEQPVYVLVESKEEEVGALKQE